MGSARTFKHARQRRPHASSNRTCGPLRKILIKCSTPSPDLPDNFRVRLDPLATHPSTHEEDILGGPEVENHFAPTSRWSLCFRTCACGEHPIDTPGSLTAAIPDSTIP